MLAQLFCRKYTATLVVEIKNQAIPIHCYTQPYLSLNAWMCNCAAWYRCQLYSRAPIRHLIGSSVAVQSGAKSVFMVL